MRAKKQFTAKKKKENPHQQISVVQFAQRLDVFSLFVE
jgi:hypothetical protein